MEYYQIVSFLLVLEINCLWVSWFANISVHSELTSSFLKVFFFGDLKLKYVAFSWFWFHCSRGWIPKDVIRTQKDLVVYILMCPAYVFLKIFIESLLTFRYLWFGVHFVYDVRECSNLILVFFLLISLAQSFIVSVIDIYCQHQGRNIPFSPRLLHQLVFVKFLTMADLSPVRGFLPVVLICIYHI